MAVVCNIVKRFNDLVRELCATRVAKVEDLVSFLTNLPNKVCTHSSLSLFLEVDPMMLYYSFRCHACHEWRPIRLQANRSPFARTKATPAGEAGSSLWA
jgi:hypothetical protein